MMMKHFRKSLFCLVFCLIPFSISGYPEKILIKNATRQPITYALDARYTNGAYLRYAYMWLEPGEEHDLEQKHFLQLDIPQQLKYLSVAINIKQPRDMEPFSKIDSHEVAFGTHKAVRITVRKDKVGSLYHTVSPLRTPAPRKMRGCRSCRKTIGHFVGQYE